MSDLVVSYASVPNLLIAWFPTVVERLSVPVSGRSISTDLPAGYKNLLPFVRVTRTGGPRALGIDRARARFETLASKYDDAETIANELDSLIEFDLNNFTDGIGRVMLTKTYAAPRAAAWDDEQVTRFIASYGITVGAQQ